ncbi:MAG TPA: hypothetical protein ENI94_02850 [Gammaproteobacteria bacterium]|nr:hypothetical protein [Gammaproteobacteria bacterium]
MHSGIAAVFPQYGGGHTGRKFHLIFTGLVITMVLSAPVAADYLSDIEAEAESSGRVPAEGSISAHGGTIGGSKLVETSGRKRFERALKVERPHIYTFYDRLPEQNKAQVADYYATSSGKISKTVNLILDLYFQKK